MTELSNIFFGQIWKLWNILEKESLWMAFNYSKEMKKLYNKSSLTPPAF